MGSNFLRHMLPYNGLTVETLEASKEAAISMSPHAVTLRAAVLEAITAASSEGLTDEEMQIGLRMKGNTQRPRRWELFHMGAITPAEFTRKTLSGRTAVVWINAKKT